LLLGITNSFAQPSRMALISSLVDRAALPSALAIQLDRVQFGALSARRSPAWSSPRPASGRLRAQRRDLRDLFAAMTRLRHVPALSGGAGATC
jgi:hypothetical protein